MRVLMNRAYGSVWKVLLILTLLVPYSLVSLDQAKGVSAAETEYELDRSGWTASAYKEVTAGHAPQYAIDGDASTRWANEEAQFDTGTQWFQIDMGQAQAFHTLTMESGSDYPRGYLIQVSDDATGWTDVSDGMGSATTTAVFDSQTARYVRIVQTGVATSSYWSINELRMYSSATGEGSQVTGVTLNTSELTLEERDNQQLVATVVPATAVNQAVTWASSNSEVAVVDAEGRVVAVGIGTAMITVETVDGGYIASSAVEVVPGPAMPAPLGQKKGVAASKYLPLDPSSTPDEQRRSIMPEQLEALDVSWAYNWSVDYNFSDTADADFEFVPMLWGPGAVTDATIEALKQGRLAGEYTHLLGYNEPELVEQSWTTVDDTIALWPRLMETGLRLGSPAVAYPADGSLDAYGIYWLEDFMEKAEALNYPVDFIALHFYQDFTHPDAVEQLRTTLIDLYDKYEKPIWITEIGAIVFGTPHAEASEQISSDYMRDVIPMLESLPFIERYAWFVDSCAHEPACAYTNLYDLNDQLTTMGTIYQTADDVTEVPVTVYDEVPNVTGDVYYGDFVWGQWYFAWNEDKAKELVNGLLRAEGTDAPLTTGQVYTHGDVVMIGLDQEATIDRIVLTSAANGEMPYKVKLEYSTAALPVPINIPSPVTPVGEFTGYSTEGNTLTIDLEEPITARTLWLQSLTDGVDQEPGTTAWTVSDIRFYQKRTVESPPSPPEDVEELTISESDGIVTLSWPVAAHAANYEIYRSMGKYSEYELLGTSETATYQDDVTGNKYQYYYKVRSVNGAGVPSEWSDDVSLEGKLFGDTMTIFSPSDDPSVINSMTAETAAKMIPMAAAEFSTDRYAFLFKPGQYNIDRVDVGYYTSIYGLGSTPLETTLPRVEVSSWGDNSLTNFWRSIENIGIDTGAATNEVKWAASQAAPARRLYVNGKLHLDDIGKQASGGYLADTWVTGQTGSWSQQQYFLRNNNLTEGWYDGVWNMMFVGVDNAPVETVPWAETAYRAYTVEEQTPIIREKPFLYLDENGDYAVFVPSLRQDALGVSWSDGNPGIGASIPISEFYVAKASVDSAATINAALAEGKHLLMTPGIYEVDQAIEVNHAHTVVLGMGLATVTPTHGNDAMHVADVDGVTIAGILFDAGEAGSDHLLQVGPEDASADHSDHPILLADVFTRIGGAVDGKADVTVEINSDDVIGDHFWLWRADHGKEADSTGWTKNIGKNGVVVNGDDVTIYGLFVEHFQEYQTLWNGENGRTFFYQSEIPYDPPYQSDYMSHDGTVKGYASYKVADHVTSHYAAALGIYDVFIHTEEWVELKNAMEVPDGTRVEHAAIVSFGVNGGTNHVINGIGGPVFGGEGKKAGIDLYYVERQQAEDVMAQLTGETDAYADAPFSLAYELSQVSGPVMAQDIVVEYDSSLADFADAESVVDGVSIVGLDTETPGTVRILLVSEGQAHAILEDGAVLRLNWTTKALEQDASGVFKLTSAMLSDGEVESAATLGEPLTLQFHTVDVQALLSLIAEAQALQGAAVEGIGAGQYPFGSKAVLQSAIDAAAATSNGEPTPEEIQLAMSELQLALQTFQQSVYESSLADTNDDGRISITDLALVSMHYGETTQSDGWDARLDVNADGLVDIHDLSLIAREVLNGG